MYLINIYTQVYKIVVSALRSGKLGKGFVQNPNATWDYEVGIMQGYYGHEAGQ